MTVRFHPAARDELRRFPYDVYFRAGADEIVVVAVAHQKRRPGYWAVR